MSCCSRSDSEQAIAGGMCFVAVCWAVQMNGYFTGSSGSSSNVDSSRSARMCNINCNPQQLGFLDYHIMVVVVMVYTASDYSMSVMHHQLISVMLRQHMNNVMRLF